MITRTPPCTAPHRCNYYTSVYGDATFQLVYFPHVYICHPAPTLYISFKALSSAFAHCSAGSSPEDDLHFIKQANWPIRTKRTRNLDVIGLGRTISFMCAPLGTIAIIFYIYALWNWGCAMAKRTCFAKHTFRVTSEYIVRARDIERDFREWCNQIGSKWSK